MLRNGADGDAPNLAPDHYPRSITSHADAAQWFDREVIPLDAALTRYLQRNWRNSAEISDLRQEVYVRVWESIAGDIPASAKAFMFRVARNLLVDRARRTSVRSVEISTDMARFDQPGDAPSPEHNTGVAQEIAHLVAAFAQLRPRLRQVIFLRRVEGLSQRDTAARMCVSEKAVEGYLAAGLRSLAELLAGKGLETRPIPP